VGGEAVRIDMDELRYSREEYENCDFYGDNDEEISVYKCKLGKCRKPHTCANCGKEIKKGDYALRESGFMDGGPVSCYTCIPCLDAWIADINGE